MRTDIRITQLEHSEVTQIISVVYDDAGEVDITFVLSEHSSLGDAYNHIDMLYRASLKPVLLKLKDGSYE